MKTEMSPTIGALAKALALAQGEITGALKDSSNPFFKSKYADLAACWDACRKPLSAHGLAVVQTTEAEDGLAVVVVTTLVHESGEWLRGYLRMNPVKPDPQGFGSCITYARRYSLAAMVGLAQVDDDAEAAQGRTESKKISPMPDAVLLTPEEEKSVRSFVNSFLDLLNADLEEDVKADKIAALRTECNEQQHIFLAVWERLKDRPKERIAIKRFVEIANKRHRAA